MERSNGRPRHALHHLGLFRITPIRAGQPGKIEDERDSHERRTLRHRVLDGQRELPFGRAAGLEERVDLRHPAQGGCIGRGQERSGSAMEDGLRRADHEREIALDERRMNPHRLVHGADDRKQIGVLRIVHDKLAVERAGLGRRKQQPDEVANTRAASEPTGDEDCLPLVRDPQPLELGDRRGERLLPGVLRHAW